MAIRQTNVGKARQQAPHCVGGEGYGLADPVVMAQMHGEDLPHTEVQAGDHWEMGEMAPA